MQQLREAIHCERTTNGIKTMKKIFSRMGGRDIGASLHGPWVGMCVPCIPANYPFFLYPNGSI